MQMVHNLLFVLAALFVLVFFFRRVPALRAFEPSVDDSAGLFSWPRRRYPVGRKDILPLLLIVVIYAFVAFLGLGSTKDPQSFSHFEANGAYAQAELAEPTDISGAMYYSGLYTGAYSLELSTDGTNFVDAAALTQDYTELFKWNTAGLTQNFSGVRFVRVVANAQLELGELALYDGAGELIPTDALRCDAAAAPLFDEQDTIPREGQTYLNSTYFDEIYHARTAYENIKNVYPYEITHPPLGKLIISVGIRIFGMDPFGWRFMGTLFGVLMLFFLYFLLKNLFGSTTIASCGTVLFAFDFMHYVQTRIATIDTYGVFFILAMTYFLYLFLTADPDDPGIPRRKRIVPLFLAGLMFGIGAASKWIVIYAGGGVAAVWAIYWIRRGLELCRAGRTRDFLKAFFANAALCLLFFILIPAAIYYVSYWPYGTSSGLSGIRMPFTGKYFDIVVGNQKYMYNYHSTLVATHPYSARWYQWIVDARPILYYLGHPTGTTVSAFGAFTNPLLTWGGLICMFYMAYLAFRKRDGRALFILVGYLSQLLPWMDISRLTFEYHYFPSMVFLTLAVCHFFSVIRRSDPHWKRSAYLFTGLSLFLFVLFYPALSGVAVPNWYGATFLKWLPSWPF